MNRDTVVGIVGAMILVAAMVGVFQYERTVGAARGGAGAPGDWLAVAVAGPAVDGTTARGQTTDSVVNVSKANLTSVTFTLSWTSTRTNVMAIAIIPPEGVAGGPFTAEGSSGSVTLKVPVGNPQPTSATAVASTMGAGDWKVTVHYKEGGSATPTPLPPVGQDETVTWKVTTSLEAWEPDTA